MHQSEGITLDILKLKSPLRNITKPLQIQIGRFQNISNMTQTNNWILEYLKNSKY